MRDFALQLERELPMGVAAGASWRPAPKAAADLHRHNSAKVLICKGKTW
jgi:hypothetical protein